MLEQNNNLYRYTVKDKVNMREQIANEQMITLLNEKVYLSLGDFNTKILNKDLEIEENKKKILELENELSILHSEKEKMRVKIETSNDQDNPNTNEIEEYKKKIKELDDEVTQMKIKIDEQNPKKDLKSSHKDIESQMIHHEVEKLIKKQNTFFGMFFNNSKTRYELRNCRLNNLLFFLKPDMIWAQKRYVLSGKTIYVFDRESSESADGEILITAGCKISKIIEKDYITHNFQFLLLHPTLKNLYFSGETEKMVDNWIYGIEDLIEEIESSKVSNRKNFFETIEKSKGTGEKKSKVIDLNS